MALAGVISWIVPMLLGGVSHGKDPTAHLWLTPTLLSVTWILSFALAHRFNTGWRCLVPFVGHLLPVLVLVAQASGTSDQARIYRIYLGILALLLVLGIGCALASVRAADQQDGAVSPPTES